MKKTLSLLTIVIFQLTFFHLYAQQPDIESDSVWVEGRVVDFATGQPLANCEVQFLFEGEAVAVTLSDSNGYYTLGWIPLGLYTFSVLSDGKTLHYNELQLTQSTIVNIALMPDTANLRPLHTTEVTAMRIGPVYHPIKSPDDPRLWNLNNNPQLMDSGPARVDYSGGPRVGFFKPGSLAAWRPAWIDAPFPHPERKTKSGEQKTKKKGKKK